MLVLMCHAYYYGFSKHRAVFTKEFDAIHMRIRFRHTNNEYEGTKGLSILPNADNDEDSAIASPDFHSPSVYWGSAD